MKPVACSIFLFCILSTANALAGDATSQSSTDATAREYYRSATTHFEFGRYREAQAAFAAGYELSHRPGFLWNMAECAYLLKDKTRALELYRQYIKEAPQDSAQRADAERRVKELAPSTETASPLGTSPSPSTSTIVVPTTSAPLSTNTSAAEPIITNHSTILVDPKRGPDEATRPITSRWWFWTTAAGVVVASALTIVLVTRSDSSTNPTPREGGLSVNWK